MDSQLTAQIEKSYVHKSYTENVFIGNLRHELPNFIDRELRLALEREDRERGTDLTAKYSPPDSDVRGCPLRSLPLSLSNEEMASLERGFDPARLNALPLARAGDEYVLTGDIREEDERAINALLGRRDRYLHDADRALLSAALERLGAIKHGRVFYANVLVPVSHPFFFEHATDHLPGLMLIEAFRQMVVAVSHRFGKVPQNETQMILDLLETRFISYAELSLPIVMKAMVDEAKVNRQGWWSTLDIRLEAYQNHELVATNRIHGAAVAAHLYGRMRERRLQALQSDYRFIPLHEGDRRISLRSEADGAVTNCRIDNLSPHGFAVSVEDASPPDRCGFFHYVNYGAVIYGRAERRWFDEPSQRAGYQIIELVPEAAAGLRDFIARGTRVQSGRYCL